MNDQTNPHVSLKWTDDGPKLTVDGVDLTNAVHAGTVRIDVPPHAGAGKPTIHFTLFVDDFHVDGVGVREEPTR